MGTGTIQQADPGARRQAIVVLCVATLLGLSAILAFEYYQADFQSWLEKNIGFLAEHTILVFVGSVLLISPVLAVAIYLLLLGRRTVRGQRFPPPGYAVARDTPVLRDSQAIQRGYLIQMLSWLVLCCAGSIPFVLWYLFRSLLALLA